MSRWGQIAWRRWTLIAVVAVSVGYAPVAMTELWPYARPGAPAIGQSFLSHVVSPRYVADALATRIRPYQHSLAALIAHSVLGGLLMILGPVQLLSAVRRRRRLHRMTGVVFAVTVYLCMAGAAVYLARTAPADAFGGAVFWIALATIGVGTVMSVTAGIFAAQEGMPDVHQRWMLLCYAFLMTAPLLRMEWGALPAVYPRLSMLEINQIATMHLGSLVVFGALLASRALDKRDTVAGVEGTCVPTAVLAAAHVAGATALTWIAVSFLGWGTQGHRLLAGYLVPYAATYVVMVLRHRRAGREGRTWAREEWRIHLTALCVAPVFSVASVWPIEKLFGIDRQAALSAGAAIGCGVLAFTATSIVTLRSQAGKEKVSLKAAAQLRAAAAKQTATVSEPAAR